MICKWCNLFVISFQHCVQTMSTFCTSYCKIILKQSQHYSYRFATRRPQFRFCSWSPRGNWVRTITQTEKNWKLSISPNVTKQEPKWIPNGSKMGSQRGSKWSPNRPKGVSKRGCPTMMQQSWFLWDFRRPFGDHFWIQNHSKRGPKNETKLDFGKWESMGGKVRKGSLKGSQHGGIVGIRLSMLCCILLIFAFPNRTFGT